MVKEDKFVDIVGYSWVAGARRMRDVKTSGGPELIKKI
jgi:hypothetical protein